MPVLEESRLKKAACCAAISRSAAQQLSPLIDGRAFAPAEVGVSFRLHCGPPGPLKSTVFDAGPILWPVPL